LFTGLIVGLILGYLLSMPPVGPTNFAIIAKGFKREIKSGVAIGAGAGFTDLFYILVAYGGVSAIYSFIPSSIKLFLELNQIYFKIGITAVGCFIVIFYGIKIMKMKVIDDEGEQIDEAEIEDIKERADEKLEKTEDEIAKIIHKKPIPKNEGSITGSFFTGILLCLSSVTLPASWFAIVSFLKGYGVIDSNFWSGFFMAVGVFLGTTAWFYTLVKFISLKSHKIKSNTLNKINISVGIILILLGVFLIYKAFDFACTLISS
jgi:threonine/homoserine/homoserine lactone efflux protein